MIRRFWLWLWGEPPPPPPAPESENEHLRRINAELLVMLERMHGLLRDVSISRSATDLGRLLQIEADVKDPELAMRKEALRQFLHEGGSPRDVFKVAAGQ